MTRHGSRGDDRRKQKPRPEFRVTNLEEIMNYLGERNTVTRRIECLRAMPEKLRKRLVFGEDPEFPDTLVMQMRSAELTRIKLMPNKPWYTPMLLSATDGTTTISSNVPNDSAKPLPDLMSLVLDNPLGNEKPVPARDLISLALDKALATEHANDDRQLLRRPTKAQINHLRQTHDFNTEDGILSFIVNNPDTRMRAIGIWAMSKGTYTRFSTGQFQSIPATLVSEMNYAYQLSKCYRANGEIAANKIEQCLSEMPEHLRSRLIFGEDPAVPVGFVRALRAAELQRCRALDVKPSYFERLVSYEAINEDLTITCQQLSTVNEPKSCAIGFYQEREAEPASTVSKDVPMVAASKEDSNSKLNGTETLFIPLGRLSMAEKGKFRDTYELNRPEKLLSFILNNPDTYTRAVGLRCMRKDLRQKLLHSEIESIPETLVNEMRYASQRACTMACPDRIEDVGHLRNIESRPTVTPNGTPSLKNDSLTMQLGTKASALKNQINFRNPANIAKYFLANAGMEERQIGWRALSRKQRGRLLKNEYMGMPPELVEELRAIHKGMQTTKFRENASNDVPPAILPVEVPPQEPMEMQRLDRTAVEITQPSYSPVDKVEYMQVLTELNTNTFISNMVRPDTRTTEPQETYHAAQTLSPTNSTISNMSTAKSKRRLKNQSIVADRLNELFGPTEPEPDPTNVSATPIREEQMSMPLLDRSPSPTNSTISSISTTKPKRKLKNQSVIANRLTEPTEPEPISTNVSATPIREEHRSPSPTNSTISSISTTKTKRKLKNQSFIANRLTELFGSSENEPVPSETPPLNNEQPQPVSPTTSTISSMSTPKSTRKLRVPMPIVPTPPPIVDEPTPPNHQDADDSADDISSNSDSNEEVIDITPDVPSVDLTDDTYDRQRPAAESSRMFVDMLTTIVNRLSEVTTSRQATPVPENESAPTVPAPAEDSNVAKPKSKRKSDDPIDEAPSNTKKKTAPKDQSKPAGLMDNVKQYLKKPAASGVDAESTASQQTPPAKKRSRVEPTAASPSGESPQSDVCARDIVLSALARNDRPPPVTTPTTTGTDPTVLQRMKDIDDRMMQLQQQKMDIDAIILQQQQQKMVIEQSVMQLQNERIQLLGDLLAGQTATTSPGAEVVAAGGATAKKRKISKRP